MRRLGLAALATQPFRQVFPHQVRNLTQAADVEEDIPIAQLRARLPWRPLPLRFGQAFAEVFRQLRAGDARAVQIRVSRQRREETSGDLAEIRQML